MTNELKKDKIIRQEVRVWCDGWYVFNQLKNSLFKKML